MPLEALLAAWSLAALAWHVLAWHLVRPPANPAPRPPHSRPPPAAPAITVFKPVPPGLHLAASLEHAIESFLRQLQPADHLLLGIPEPAAAAWNPAVQRWRLAHPGLIFILTHTAPQPGANPKIRHLRQLAAHAPEGLWLWSDADISAPPGFLESLRAAWQSRGRARLVTAPYTIENLRDPRALADAALVHLQVLPGLLFLAPQGKAPAVGAAALFDSREFNAAVSWPELENTLADDHRLGRLLAPVAVARARCATLPETASWRQAWNHLVRWQTAIHWSAPAGSFAHLAVLPLIGWTLATLARPSPALATATIAWAAWETLWIAAIHRRLRCRTSPATVLALPLVPWLRAAAWAAAWLPLPIHWNGAPWTGARPCARLAARMAAPFTRALPPCYRPTMPAKNPATPEAP